MTNIQLPFVNDEINNKLKKQQQKQQKPVFNYLNFLISGRPNKETKLKLIENNISPYLIDLFFLVTSNESLTTSVR
ncbi:hypothetical protein DERP_001984 [Dermatophagoides pteronyssinus]|uniref:Uncharacterized protein n=1 Tax=Dermatophagoides pteronyssinus TaxID=6956 RepID=A0ABQ8JC61_DERPT|nr:hypothetical protein DERP_001984 [Dermatophagoides pteronyssinus]